MKRKAKKILLAAATLILFCAVVFVCARWGWKAFGYMTCRVFVGVEKAGIDGGDVYLKGFDPGSFPSFYVGHIYNIDGSDMYVGIKYNMLLGVLPKETGDFEIRIPAKGKKIENIYLKNNKNTRLIWNAQRGRIEP